MAMDPEELVTLTDHGTMKLRSAVVRAMILSAKERKGATIVREGEPAILNFKQIRNLGAKWDERRGSSPRGNRFHKRQRQQRRIRSRGNGRKSRSIARWLFPPRYTRRWWLSRLTSGTTAPRVNAAVREGPQRAPLWRHGASAPRPTGL